MIPIDIPVWIVVFILILASATIVVHIITRLAAYMLGMVGIFLDTSAMFGIISLAGIVVVYYGASQSSEEILLLGLAVMTFGNIRSIRRVVNWLVRITD